MHFFVNVGFDPHQEEQKACSWACELWRICISTDFHVLGSGLCHRSLTNTRRDGNVYYSHQCLQKTMIKTALHKVTEIQIMT